MKVRDSRRLTGPNILWAHPGAVLDVAVEAEEDPTAAIAAWRREAHRLLEAVGWSDQELCTRTFKGGVSLALSAPLDALYAATEVNEAAWEIAVRSLQGELTPSLDDPDLEATVARLRREISDEGNPALLLLQQVAKEHGVAFLSDDDDVSVGLGRGSRTWPVSELPSPGEVDWDEVFDIPVALVTGTNGKTTTVRLLAAMALAAGKSPGFCSTEGVFVGSKLVEKGDYAGPGGGRRVLRDRRVDLAILETARGGMLRRGLAVSRAEVAVITNVAEDHLGEWGIHDLDELAETKLIVRRVAERLVINHDDPVLQPKGKALSQAVSWFSLENCLENPLESTAQGVFLAGDRLVLRESATPVTIARTQEAPMTLGGAARHNVANALAAIGAAAALGLSPAAMKQGLATFGQEAEANPGRLNRFQLGGLEVLVDFAHNPHGMEALMATASGLEARRRLLLLGQAGDRDDPSLRALAAAAWSGRPDHIVLKELEGDLRGRQLGEIPRLLADELTRLGAPPEALSFADTELAAAKQALAMGQPGDLLLLICHVSRGEVLALLDDLKARGWKAGEPLP